MYSVIAILDRPARARLSWIQSFAASFGVVPRPIYGHITLASFEDDGLIPACADALAGQTAFSVDFPGVDILEGEPVVAALAAREGTLEAVQETLCAALNIREKEVPHVALIREERLNLSWVRTAMGQMFQPYSARVEAIEIVRDTNGGFEVLKRVELKGDSV